MAFLEMDNVIKIYKSASLEVVALRGLSMKVARGEIVAIMGPSGSGKTTLLNMIGGLDSPNAGTVTVNGRSVMKLDEKELVAYRRRQVGFVFQFFNLIPTLSARENMELPLRFAGVPTRKRKERVDHLMELIGLTSREKHKPDELSGGEQQRIAIGVALANDPEIILADEPTGELDTETGEEVLDIFKTLKSEYGKTIIIVTHDKRITAIADRIFNIVDGVIVEGKRDPGETMQKVLDAFDSKGRRIGPPERSIVGKKKGKRRKKSEKSTCETEKRDSKLRDKDRRELNIGSSGGSVILPIEGTGKYLRIEISDVMDDTQKGGSDTSKATMERGKKQV